MSDDRSLYQRALDLVRSRASVSITNLKTSLNCSDAQAKSFLRIMREEGVVGAPMANLGRYPVVQALRVEAQPVNAIINFDAPELSAIHGRDVPIDDILDADRQARLTKIMTELVNLEGQQAAITDQRRLVMEVARATGLAPPVLKKIASALFRDRKADLLKGMDLTRLYLHALGELIEDPRDDVILSGGDDGTRH